eukprot:CAMPEP_0176309522 /NCGR_PEP_ID=MMETSP0121_2-20121125/65123_1 /TAXON_ID=160619 /ORGANISM="Kryptoperidinium foliaceum, Strain CCMP 1326" /LENGTH=113 /DNA_ID=CAMNT_0017651429 /DNA_START=202 /DNA_END=540 /DNA_ORIENTATION=+
MGVGIVAFVQPRPRFRSPEAHRSHRRLAHAGSGRSRRGWGVVGGPQPSFYALPRAVARTSTCERGGSQVQAPQGARGAGIGGLSATEAGRSGGPWAARVAGHGPNPCDAGGRA